MRTWTRSRLTAGLLMAVCSLACGSTQGDGYTYAACTNEGGGACPDSGIFTCAIQTLAEKHSTCVADADCKLVGLEDCLSLTACGAGIAVRVDAARAFKDEADLEIARYCDEAACVSAPSCAAGFEYQAFCESDGHCARRVIASPSP